IDGDLLGGEEFLEGLVHARLDVVVVQGDGPLAGGDGGGVPVGQLGQLALEAADVAQGGAHEQELRLRQLQQGQLPGPAALRVRVVVELVHDDHADVGVLALAQGNVGQDLGRAADDGGVLVHGGVSRDHADVFGPEDLAQGKELLGDERLDGGRVVACGAAGHGVEVGGDGHHGLARARGG